jgi:hypothetical protein
MPTKLGVRYRSSVRSKWKSRLRPGKSKKRGGDALSPELPRPGMQIGPADTALVITDPQNDFLSDNGAMWGLLAKVCKKTVSPKTSRPC